MIKNQNQYRKISEFEALERFNNGEQIYILTADERTIYSVESKQEIETVNGWCLINK